MGAMAAAAIAGATAAGAAINAASGAASSSSGNMSMNSLNFKHLRELSIPYNAGSYKTIHHEVVDDVYDAITLCEDFEILGKLVEEYTVEEPVRIFSKTTKKATKRRIIYKPISEVIKTLLPADATVVNVVIDWHRILVRVYYTLP